jgi:hypothetical protein
MHGSYRAANLTYGKDELVFGTKGPIGLLIAVK